MSDSAAAGPAAQKGTLPEQQVEAMFDRIAKRYDLMNTVMTAGLHDEWRRRAVQVESSWQSDESESDAALLAVDLEVGLKPNRRFAHEPDSVSHRLCAG